MKVALIVTTGVAAAIAASAFASASPAAENGGMPCKPKITKISGKPAMALCGPATLTLKVGGKSYSYKDGLCQANGSTTFELDLGSLVTADLKHNHGLPYFSMTVSHKTADVTAQYGGKDLVGGMTLVTVKGSMSNSGTFAGRLLTPKVSGSWNCHGVIVKT
jgi:hypothetical protein